MEQIKLFGYLFLGQLILNEMVSLYYINNSIIILKLLFLDMGLFTSIAAQTEFRLVSTSRDTDPPLFTLTFVVDKRPPTNVTCTVEVDDGGSTVISDISYDDLSREVLVSEDPISVQVIVTIGMRQGGTYQCTVSNDAPNGNTATTQVITVTGIYI